MSVLYTPIAPSALRQYGEWSLDEPYDYVDGPKGRMAVKRLRWRGEVEAVHGGAKLWLVYVANAFVDPKRMNELTYLAAQERQALDYLETMVLAATNGVGYVMALNPVEVTSNAMLALVGGWIQSTRYPENWARQIAETSAAAVQLIIENQTALATMQASPDPEHVEWGLAIRVKPIEPKEGV